MTSVDFTELPTISIYQDADHIEGILQQANQGLITDHSQSQDTRDTKGTETDTTGGGEVGGSLRVPGVGGVEAKAKLSASDGGSTEKMASRALTSNFRYTSAYHLHHVRQSLSRAGKLKSVDSEHDVTRLTVGDLVEFQASFEPDELIALLDVMNPNLIAALVRWMRQTQLIGQYTEAETEEDMQQAARQLEAGLPQADADGARAIAEAFRVDFRSEYTREYYGSLIGVSEVTAAVVCDVRRFLVDDPDRMLDGHFTVFGKIATPPQADVPILARNKVLDRIKPDAVDLVTQELGKIAREKVDDGKSPDAVKRAVSDFLDLDFESRVRGKSFKVLPIAIYI